jgi:DNA-binding NarL/FixJ family response regulator
VGPSSSHGGTIPSPARHLTPRQLQVLRLAANGRTNREIGRQLGITEDTVKSQMAVVLRRLHVEDRAQAVAVGIRLGLVSVDAVTISPRPARLKRQAPIVEKSPLVEELEDQLADIGDRVRAERQARGWSQAELARRAELGTVALGNLECGRATSLSTLVLACRALGVDMARVLSTDWRMPETGPALTPQQLSVLREAASGGSLTEIGARLGMTGPEVGSTLTRIYQRLEVTHVPRSERRAAAVRVAVQYGLLESANRTS